MGSLIVALLVSGLFDLCLRAGSGVGLESGARARGGPALFPRGQDGLTASCGSKLDLGVQLVMALGGLA